MDDVIGHAILDVINEVWSTGAVEPDWRTIVQIPIPKKGDLSQLENWRPICLVNVIVKIMNRMIYNRIGPVVDSQLRDAQFGFRPHRSTASAQLLVNEVIAKAQRDRTPLYLGFVDFAKAFPSISFSSIRAALEAFTIPVKLRRMILALYDGTIAYVRTPLGDTEPFPVETGTLQGDVLAPLLFIMVLDRVLHAALDEHDDGLLLRKRGTRSRPQRGDLLTDVDYADDIVLFAHDDTQLQRMLSRVVVEAARVNLRLNVGPSKTAYMALHANAPECIHVPGLPPIPRVRTYKYLGQEKRDFSVAASLDARLRLAWAATHRLAPFWRLPLRPSTKLRIFDAVVYPVLMYGLSTLPLSDSQCALVDRQMSRMRMMVLGVRRWHDNLPLNAASLYGDTRRFPFRFRLERARHLGHSLRHSVLLRRVVEWRASDAWTHRNFSVSEGCAKDLHLYYGSDLIDAALDRSRWRACLTALERDLDPCKSYTAVTEARWATARSRARTLHELQFVEEGSTLFPHIGDEIHVYTDGSALSHGVGSGLAIVNKAGIVQTTEYIPLPAGSTPNSALAEITAARAAVELASKQHKDVVIHTDSHLVWNFLHNLRARFRLVGYGHLGHAEQLCALDASIRDLEHRQGHRVYAVKVRGHNGNEGNHAADVAAGYAAAVSQGLSGAALARADNAGSTCEAPGTAVRACLRHVCVHCQRRYKTSAALKCHVTKVHTTLCHVGVQKPKKKISSFVSRAVIPEDHGPSSLHRALAAVLRGTASRKRSCDQPTL